MAKDGDSRNMIERRTPIPRPSRLVIATHNSGKLREFCDLLAPYVDGITSAGELNLPEPEETGTTFNENALLKARAAAQLSGSLALADDSGFCVTSLDGRPGLYSARWALVPRNSEIIRHENAGIPLPPREGLEEGVISNPNDGVANDPSPAKTKGLPAQTQVFASSPARGEGPLFIKDFSVAMKRVHDELGNAENRSAHFICVLALAWPDGRTETVEGRIDGQFVWPPRGTRGHGYDPVFMPDGDNRTFAEMDEDEKNAISHRGIAVRHLIERFFS